MKQDELMKVISELESEIAILPQGSITKKRINGKEYCYHRISQNGKRTEKYKKRDCIGALREYIFGEWKEKVFIIYGLRRTGKTTMIRQILAELPSDFV